MGDGQTQLRFFDSSIFRLLSGLGLRATVEKKDDEMMNHTWETLMPFGKTCLCIDLMTLGCPQQLWEISHVCECNYHEIVLQYKAGTTGTDV